MAIDGPGGVGKSTVAKAVARHLQIPYLATGAMYRALGLRVLEEEVDPEDEEGVVEIAGRLDLTIDARPDGSAEILLDREPLGERVRDESVARITSKVAAYPAVRRPTGGGLFTGREGTLGYKRIAQLFKRYARQAKIPPTYAGQCLRQLRATHRR